MESETKEQFDESSARTLTNIGFGLSVLAILSAALVAPFVAGVWVLSAATGLIAMVCGLAARDKSTRSGQWHGLAGVSALLGGVAIIAALMTQV
ncbi:MAG TPA: hypothetical protein VNA12_04235 [Mycobacteriales bacterium]|nr:hypothetical protein [Mycobacteriales bacterium]